MPGQSFVTVGIEAYYSREYAEKQMVNDRYEFMEKCMTARDRGYGEEEVYDTIKKTNYKMVMFDYDVMAVRQNGYISIFSRT